MKRRFYLLTVFLTLLLCGCSRKMPQYNIVATTLPVYSFTSDICQGTNLTVGRLVTENVSCLHDYTLDVGQMRMVEQADAIVISGAGLEDFMDDALHGARGIIDASKNTHIHEGGHNHNNEAHEGHSHEHDPHIWLSPENAKIMAESICNGLIGRYPEYKGVFLDNLETLTEKLDALQVYGDTQLSTLSCRELITFHDGFAYFAESFDLTILEAVEEESGSEASAAELIHLIQQVNEHSLPAVFTEKSCSDAAAGIIATETGAEIFTLDMVMSGDSYFDAMYYNIDTIKEALG